MFTFSKKIACVAMLLTFNVCTFAELQTKAETELELMNKYAQYLLECAKTHPITSYDMEKLKNKEMPSSKAAKCWFACAYKMAGIMNEDGELSVERVYETTRMVLKDDYERQQAKNYINACTYVNQVDVGPEDKDCERAALIFKCTVAKASQALTDAEVKEEFIKHVMKCLKDHPVEMSEVLALQQLITPKNKEAKCLLACAYKSEGTMNAKGLYDTEHAYKVAELAKGGDEKRLENGKKMADTCSKVNAVEVSDGENGCDRAALIFKCIVDNAPKYGFKV